ncbi:phage major capsid protein [Streptomyces sviceus]|uniref:phage major capsid protein n=1 Tax=Streptomyces sviceus TaxID=285530 RepID=UPI0036E8A0ED
MNEIHSRSGDAELDDADQERWNAAEAFVERAQRAQEGLLNNLRAGAYERAGDSRTARRGPQAGSQARQVLESYERGQRAELLDDRSLQKLHTTLDEGEGAEYDEMSRWLTITGNPHYERAVAKLFRDPDHGSRDFTREELSAWQAARNLQRSVSVYQGGSSGGFLAPVHLDPAVLLSGDGVASSFRSLARTVTISTESWRGVTSAGTSAYWIPENQSAQESQAQFDQPVITPQKRVAYLIASFEALGDTNIQREAQNLIRDEFASQENQAFTYGAGDAFGEPTGVLTALADGSQDVPTAVSGVYDREDALAFQESLAPRWRANRPAIQGSLHALNLTRAFPLLAGGVETSLVAEGNPPTLRGTPWFENSSMDDGEQPGDAIAVLADWKQFLIADRVGASFELIQNVMDASTQRPTGQRGIMAWTRTGSGVLVPEAFKLLRLAGGS